VDCNIHRFGAVLSEQVASGWGYSYYVIDRIDGPLSTMMACPEETRERRFVSAPLGDSLVPYNSRLPLVVYVPDGFDVRYRVWSAGAATQSASPE
jgi:ecotin